MNLSFPERQNPINENCKCFLMLYRPQIFFSRQALVVKQIDRGNFLVFPLERSVSTSRQSSYVCRVFVILKYASDVDHFLLECIWVVKFFTHCCRHRTIPFFILYVTFALFSYFDASIYFECKHHIH